MGHRDDSSLMTIAARNLLPVAACDMWVREEPGWMCTAQQAVVI